ncbi:MAG TPA: methylenetetrahydrofolate reductase [Steroidobacteraceae bacterium]|jgi:5,10-methylenetetrahydrofolate reductase|nr:methylenetetrahydrofolate reductase [Steroidobacteraceae bacterium]
MKQFEQKIRSGNFTVTTELTPPKGIDLAQFFAKADALKGLVDAINITESPRARMAAEPKSVGHLLQDRGIEAIVQITARDRNRIAIQADLLGGYLLGIANFIFMTGDDPKNGDHPETKGVFDLTTIELLNAARSLRSGRDLSGNDLHGAPQMFLGSTINPGAPDFDRETENARRKIDAGSQFFQSQAIYDTGLLARFLDAAKLGDVPLLAGVIPLKTAKMGRWLNEKVPGIQVPAAILDEMERAGADGEAAKGVEIAVRTVRELRNICNGVHLMAIGGEDRLPEILRTAGICAG